MRAGGTSCSQVKCATLLVAQALMSAPIDLDGCIDRSCGLPYPDWDAIRERIEAAIELSARPAVWTSVARQWLEELCEVYGREHYSIEETENFLIFSWLPRRQVDLVARMCEYCRERMLAGMPTLAATASPGKEILIACYHAEDYYGYVSAYHEEGEYGGSGGMQIRDGYPHIVVRGKEYNQIEPVIAHELTHAYLSHRSLPLWIEEGLAQMIESEITSLRPPLEIRAERKREHLEHWRKHGLDAFWRGSSFSAPDESQMLSYELAEILLRLLFLDFRPRWLGFDQRPRLRLMSFLENARQEDYGQAAASTHLGYDLGILASNFLGSGEWSPGETSPGGTANLPPQSPFPGLAINPRRLPSGNCRYLCSLVSFDR